MIIAHQTIRSAILLKNEDDEWPKEKRPQVATATATSKDANVTLSMQTGRKAPLAGLQPDRRGGE
jgi:hypothetical protein